MKIPTYTSRSTIQEFTPGASFRQLARKSPQAMAQAELDKSKPMQALLNGATQFAATVWQASQEAQYNEAALAIEEGMREAELTLGSTKDIYNVLDGKNLWQESMDELRDATISSIGNRDLQQKLKYSFEQNEISARFRLRKSINDKILAREQAAMARRMEAVRRNLSTPGSTPDDYDRALGIVVNDQAKAVRGGRYSVDGVTKANYKLRTDIAADYIAQSFSNDPNAAMQLFGLMSLQDEVNAGTVSAEDAMARAGIQDAYALHVLYNLERADAVDIIQMNLSTSLKFFDAQQKLENNFEQSINDRNKKAYNFVMSVQSTEEVTPDTLRTLLGDQAFNALPESTKELGTSGLVAKELLSDHLNNQFWATPEQQENMSKELETISQYKFAPSGSGDDVRYSQLYALAERGMLTIEELNTDTFRITAQQHKELSIKIFNEADESLSVGSRLLKRAFKYNELDAQTDNPTLARASKSAFENADYALQDEFSRREAAGNPMTLQEIRDFAKEQIDLFGESYRDELRLELEDFIKDTTIPGLGGGVPIDPTDPINSLESWYNSLDAATQNSKRTAYLTQKRVIRARFANQGLGF